MKTDAIERVIQEGTCSTTNMEARAELAAAGVKPIVRIIGQVHRKPVNAGEAVKVNAVRIEQRVPGIARPLRG